MKKTFTILIIVVLAHITAFAQNERRLALVIGNAEYVGKGNTLRNPVNDANDVSTKLKTLGFDVTTVLNASMLEMDDAIDAFGRKAKDYDIVLFYYSGHGLQSKGDNYLVPVDAELRSEADVKYKCTAVNLLLDKLDESECPMKIVVLDACRNNPFAKSWHRGEFSRGLASVNPPKGTFITFSTASGSVALDGTGRNSPYTTAFLETLNTPNLSLFDFFNEVGKLVLKTTDAEQDPWTNHNTMTGSFFFNKVDLSMLDAQTQLHVFPEWISSNHKGSCIGVSMPVKDKATAKKMALVNAAIKHFMRKGNLDMASHGSMEINNKTFDSPFLGAIVSEDQSFTANTFLLSPSFNIKVIDEFYNKNNECFLSCCISEDSLAHCTIKIEQGIKIDQTQKHLSYSVSALIDEEPIQIDFSYTIKAFGEPDIQLSIDNTPTPIIPIHYPDIQFQESPIPFSNYFNIAMYGSIGLAELAFISQSPIIPTSVTFCNQTFEQGINEASISQFSTVFTALCKTQHFNLSFNEISNNRIGITIHDPYDELHTSTNPKKYFEYVQLINNGDAVPSDHQQVLESDSIVMEWVSHEFEPLLLEKTMAMYQAAYLLSQKVTSHFTAKTGRDTLGIMNLDFVQTSVVSDFHPFFFMDGNVMDSEKKHGINKVCVAYDKSITSTKD